MMVGRLSSIFPTDYKDTILPMRPGFGWTRHDKHVSNPAASDPTVRNGLSCMGCHTEGMKTFEDEVRPVIESNANPAYDKAQALRLYVEKSEMDVLVGEDMERYRGALEATGGMAGDIEPISRFHEVFQGPVDAAYAAAVVGLETEVFQEKIRENVGLQNAGLLVLDSANGSMKRGRMDIKFPGHNFRVGFPGEFHPPDSHNTAGSDTGCCCSHTGPKPARCNSRGTW